MAHRAGAWEAMYGSNEEDQVEQLTGKMAGNEKANKNPSHCQGHLLHPPPFAMDEDDSFGGPHMDRGSHPPASATIDPRLLQSEAERGRDCSSRSDEDMFDTQRKSTSGNASSTDGPATKRRKAELTGSSQDEHLTWCASTSDVPSERAAYLNDVAAEAVATASETHSKWDESEDDSEEEADFRNDIQRCEAYIMSLQSCLDLYKTNKRMEMAAIMAMKLESVIDALNRSS